MSLILKKITPPIVVLVSFITITGVQASRDMERVPLAVTPISGDSVATEYRLNSPFKVDREKNILNKNIGTNSVHENKYLSLVKGGLLSKELETWINKSGYTLLWNSNRDYIIYNTITFNADSFDNILNELGNLFESENYGLVIKQYEVNKVIIIDAQ
ncbi:TcpQ domain-containing protein [Hafnia paralvei]|uniref:TcpQ domain-containing protein n=1 Tax=Hafnia paralvei TaxID=546367 RepID=UPI001D104F72|nr:TcpQ domain-containing protein [Hafnia paralvei]